MSKPTFLPFFKYQECQESLSAFSLRTVSAKQAPLPVPVRTISKQDQEPLSAPGPLHGQVAGLFHPILVF